MLSKLFNRTLSSKKSLLMIICLIISLIILQQSVLQTETTFLTLGFSNVFDIQDGNVASSSFRIQLFKGKCLGSINGTYAESVFCNPIQKQSFVFTIDGRLMFEHTRKCLQKVNVSISGGGYLLKIGDCTRGSTFSLINKTYFRLKNSHHTFANAMCITPVKIDNSTEPSTIEPIFNPKEGNLVGLTTCHRNLSIVRPIEETTFLSRRKALILPPSPPNSPCNYPVCGLNKRAPPVKVLPPDQITRCHDLSQCVTVVTKTARRPYLVTRLAQSIRDVKGYDLPIIVVDDGGEPYSQDVMRNLSRYPNLNYIIGDNEDLGIALGRTLAVQQVKTKYFLLFDDDSVVNNQTNIELLVEILDTTDASLVGGKITDQGKFAGLLHFGYSKFDGLKELTHYKGACSKLNETIGNFPECVRCDVTTNVFMAKTKDVLEVGGWSEELKINEHKDLFLRLKAAHKKVAYCEGFQIHNEKEKGEERDPVYQQKRYARYGHMKAWFQNIWNVDRVVETFFKTMGDDVLSEIRRES